MAGDNRSGRGDRGSVGRVVGVLALVVFFAVMLVVIVGLTFSVQVTGSSMEPTLHSGDRLSSNILGRDHVERFDLVQTQAGEGGIEVVKRVIGMPGDRVRIDGGPRPTVLVRPAGEQATYVVDNPAWPSRTGDRLQSCCTGQGEMLSGDAKGRWVTVPDDGYWLLGDNWGGSDDSRVFGFVRHDMVSATLSFRLLPVSRFGRLPDDVRLVAR